MKTIVILLSVTLALSCSTKQIETQARPTEAEFQAETVIASDRAIEPPTAAVRPRPSASPAAVGEEDAPVRDADKTVEALVAALRSQDDQARRRAAQGLGRLGAKAKAAIPALAGAMKDKDNRVRFAAAHALAQVGPAGRAVLIEYLKSGDHYQRRIAALAFYKLGPAAKDAVSALTRALKDKNYRMRSAAALALGAIGPPARSAVPVLVGMFNDPHWTPRSAAARALAKIAPPAEVAVPVLIAAVKGRDDDIRAWAAQIVGEFGAEAKAAVPALIGALKDERDAVRWRASEGLGGIGAPAVSALIGALKDDHAEVRYQAAQALGRTGQAGKPAVPVLTEALTDKAKRVRYSAAVGLVRIIRHRDVVNRNMRDELDWPDDPEPAVAAALPVLIQILEDKARGNLMIMNAAASLGKIGPPAKPAVGALIKRALRHPDPHVQRPAARALGAIGPVTEDVIPALKRAAKDGGPGVPEAVAEAMEMIQRRPKELRLRATPGGGLECKARVISTKLPFGQEPRFQVTLTNVSKEPIDVIGAAAPRETPPGRQRYPCVCVRIVHPDGRYDLRRYDSGKGSATAVRIKPGKSWSFEFPAKQEHAGGGPHAGKGVLPPLSDLLPGEYTARICYFVRKTEQERLGPGLVYAADMGELAGEKPKRLWRGVLHSASMRFNVLARDLKPLAALRAVHVSEGRGHMAHGLYAIVGTENRVELASRHDTISGKPRSGCEQESVWTISGK